MFFKSIPEDSKASKTSSFEEIVKAALVTGKLTIVRILTAFGRAKLNAVILGAIGVGLYSQANYLALFLTSACSMGLVNGMMQRISYSKQRNLHDYRREVQSTVLTTQLFLSLLLILFSLFFVTEINKQVFGAANRSLNPYLVGIIFSVPFTVVSSNYIEGFFFSYGRYDLYTNASIWANIAGLVFFIPMVYFWGIRGAFISILINNVILFVAYLYFIRKIERLKNIFVFGFKKKIFREILPEGLVNLFYGALIPLSALFIRGLILRFEGSVENGLYQICTSITALYVPFLTNPLWAKFFPEISAKGVTKSSIGFFYNTLIFVTLLSAFCILGLFVKPDWIILILSSHEFTGSVKFFPAYFLGDFFFNILFLYSVYLLAIRKIREYFIIWSLYFIVQCVSSEILLMRYHTTGVALSYAVSGALALVYILVIFARLFKNSIYKILSLILFSSLMIIGEGILLINNYAFIWRIGGFLLWVLVIIYFQRASLKKIGNSF